MKCCSECGQPVPERRGGVVLTPVKLRIFDTIRGAGTIGITTRDLMTIVYEGERAPRHNATIRSHIFQINELMAGTDYQIMAHDDRRHWFLTKRKM